MNTRNHGKYVASGTVVIGALGGAAAHAQLLINFPTAATATTPDTLYFDVDDSQFSTTDTSLEFSVNTDESFPFSPKAAANTLLSEGVTSSTLSPGDTVDSNSTFTAGGLGSTKLSNGTNYVGYYLYEPLRLTPDYGYFVIEQTEVDTQGPLGAIIPVFTDTLVETVFDPTRGHGVTVTAAPEPGTVSLLFAGAAGAAGLAAWRRRVTA